MEWISVKDKLPYHEQIVDIYLKNNRRITDAMYIDPLLYGDSDEKHFYYNEGISFGIEFVSHWMSLPEPPTN